MTDTDAANLLIALGGTGVTRDAGKAIRQFRPMRGRIIGLNDEFTNSFQEWLKPLGLGQQVFSVSTNFGDFLEFLIHEAGTGALARFLRKIPTADVVDAAKRGSYRLDDPFVLNRKGPTETQVGLDILVSIKFVRTTPKIEVEFKRFWDSLEDLLLIEFYPEAPNYTEPEPYRVTADVGLYPIMALGVSLSGIRIPKNLRSPEDFCHFFANHESGPL